MASNEYDEQDEYYQPRQTEYAHSERRDQIDRYRKIEYRAYQVENEQDHKAEQGVQQEFENQSDRFFNYFEKYYEDKDDNYQSDNGKHRHLTSFRA